MFSSSPNKMVTMKIDPAWLEDASDTAVCPVCSMVLDQPTVGCPEGHAFCRTCYVAALSHSKACPLCRHPTDHERLTKCRPLEDLIGQLRIRCKHGSNDGKQEEDCCWRGRVCELAGHLNESCAYEFGGCPNAVAGCKELVLRKDAARHASETCAYRQELCQHCRDPFEVRNLPGHEGVCPEAQLECPNAGCGESVARRNMAEHRGGCGREEVGCPCPGCKERMARAEVEKHAEASGAVHERMAWGRVAEMEKTMADQGRTIAEQTESIKGQVDVIVKQKEEIAGLRGDQRKLEQKMGQQEQRMGQQGIKIAAQAETITKQNSAMAGMQRRAEALTRVFTWSIDRSNNGESAKYTFTDGVRGHGFASKPSAQNSTPWMGFQLDKGPTCLMHYTCYILDKNDKIIRVLSDQTDDDFEKPPVGIASTGEGTGTSFNWTAGDQAAARADGTTKLRMAVYLYLPS